MRDGVKHAYKLAASYDYDGVRWRIEVSYDKYDSGCCVPLSILRQVFNRGMAAWKVEHRPGVTQQQQTYGRVNSFITDSGGDRSADADLWARVKRTKRQEESVILRQTPLLAEDVCAGRQRNKPWRTSGGPKKFAVCASDGERTKLVRFGGPNLSIKRHRPERLKNFRARHGCDNPGPRTKAKYWACQATWHPRKRVSDVVESFVTIQEADDRLRNLERRARSDDSGAWEALDRARQRVGQGARYTRILRQHEGDPDHSDVIDARARMIQAIQRHKRGTGSPV